MKVLRILLPAAFLGSLASGAVHEFGHALVASWFGAKLQGIHLFWIFGPPHINYSGSFTPAHLAAISISGMALTILTGLVALVVIPFQRLSSGWAVALAVAACTLLSQSLAWVILPIVSMTGTRPSDDVTNFMDQSGASPALTLMLGFMILGISVTLFFWRTRFVTRFRELKQAINSQGTSRAL